MALLPKEFEFYFAKEIIEVFWFFDAFAGVDNGDVFETDFHAH
jgi:hypothetical protein